MELTDEERELDPLPASSVRGRFGVGEDTLRRIREEKLSRFLDRMRVALR